MGNINPEQMQQAMSQMMNNPMMQNVMNDPEMLRNMFSSNPAIQQVNKCFGVGLRQCIAFTCQANLPAIVCAVLSAVDGPQPGVCTGAEQPSAAAGGHASRYKPSELQTQSQSTLLVYLAVRSSCLPS